MRSLAATILCLVLPAAVLAQEMPEPAPQLKKLEAMVGSWEGSGTATMAPGAPAGPWTSKESGHWVLGGHFLRQDTAIDTGMPGMAPLQMTSLTGWDRENERFTSCEVSSMGSIAISTWHFDDDGTIIQVSAGVEDGQPTLDRWVTKLQGNTMTYVGHRAMGNSDFFVHVEGKSKRVSKKPTDIDVVDASFMAPDAGPMKRFAGFVGVYDVKGMWRPSNEAQPMAITGVETNALIYGGTILSQHVDGQPGDYEALAYTAWDPASKAYTNVSVTNMGDLSIGSCGWVDDVFVYSASQRVQGQPTVRHGLTRFAADGTIASNRSYHIMGVSDPLLAFESTYKKR